MGADSTGKDVVKVGVVGGSFTVTLPAAYAKANEIKKGDTMAAHHDGDRITYKPLNIEDIPPCK